MVICGPASGMGYVIKATSFTYKDLIIGLTCTQSAGPLIFALPPPV
jgi:hypothetical protein